MREYKIVKCDLWWNIYRRREVWKMINMEFLNGNGKWTTNKSFARIFYHREDAVSALVVMKMKWENSLSE